MERLLSIVVPLYNEEDSIKELYAEIRDNCAKSVSNGVINGWELFFVSDGSADGSERLIKDLIEKRNKSKCDTPDRGGAVHLIAFRKNFGKAAALQAGFKHANGDIVITMDADLQDDPAEIENFIRKIDEGWDLVSGWKYNRLDPLEKRLPSKLFNKVTSSLSGVKLHDFNCGFKAYRKEVVKSIDLYGEMHRYIPVLANRKGFRITEIKVHHRKREHGKSKYGMERYLRGLFDSMTTSFLSRFYDRPMYFFGKLGLLLFFAGFAICGYLTVLKIMGQTIGGRPMLALGVLCIVLGIQSFTTGFIGDMIVDSTFHNRYTESHIKEII